MTLREKLIGIALKWHQAYGNAPGITGTLGEYDAAMMVGCTEEEYRSQMRDRSVVARGYDFKHCGKRYQVRANRPSGRRGSPVTWVRKPRNYEWDFFLWVHYNTDFKPREVWLWPVADFRTRLGEKRRLSPADIRQGKRLYPKHDEG